MAKKKNDESIGCIAIVIGLFVLTWIAQNILGVLGVFIIVLAIFLRHYKRKINQYVFWVTFAIGVITTAAWFG